jgi:hypothetical protein
MSTATPVVGQEVSLRVVAQDGSQLATARWNFGDGQEAVGVVTGHRWAAAKSYQVSVQATGPDGWHAVASVTVPVTGRPRLVVTVPPTGGTVTGGGIACPPTCTVITDPGRSVTLTATATPPFAFTGWGGACSGTAGCTVVMTGDRTVSAGFASTAPTVSVQVSFVAGSDISLCPPPANGGAQYRATFTVSGPMTVQYRWTTSFGNDTDPSVQTITFTGTGPQTRTVQHKEGFYLPGQTGNDTVFVQVLSPVTVESNRTRFHGPNCQLPPPPSSPPPSPIPTPSATPRPTLSRTP